MDATLTSDDDDSSNDAIGRIVRNIARTTSAGQFSALSNTAWFKSTIPTLAELGLINQTYAKLENHQWFANVLPQPSAVDFISARGLGWTYAQAFLKSGARVIVHASIDVSLEEAWLKLSAFPEDRWQTCSFNVSDSDRVEAGITDLVTQGFAPSVLVNNAGIQRRGNLLDLESATWNDVIAVNLSGTYCVGAAVGRLMRDAGRGKIINIGSVTTERARKGVGPYTAAKFGVHGLTNAMAVDFAEWNIQVNTLSPGYFRTEMNAALVNDPQFDRWLRDRTPADRWGETEELVGALLFFASVDSDFVTGQNMVIDGGMVAAL